MATTNESNQEDNKPATFGSSSTTTGGFGSFSSAAATTGVFGAFSFGASSSGSNPFARSSSSTSTFPVFGTLAAVKANSSTSDGVANEDDGAAGDEDNEVNPEDDDTVGDAAFGKIYPMPENVAVVTGEENEECVLQVRAKLFRLSLPGEKLLLSLSSRVAETSPPSSSSGVIITQTPTNAPENTETEKIDESTAAPTSELVKSSSSSTVEIASSSSLAAGEAQAVVSNAETGVVVGVVGATAGAANSSSVTAEWVEVGIGPVRLLRPISASKLRSPERKGSIIGSSLSSLSSPIAIAIAGGGGGSSGVNSEGVSASASANVDGGLASAVVTAAAATTVKAPRLVMRREDKKGGHGKLTSITLVAMLNDSVCGLDINYNIMMIIVSSCMLH
jgi:hypothetical protein